MLFLNEQWVSTDEKELALGHLVTYRQEKMKYSDAIIKDEIFTLIVPLVMLFDETGSKKQIYRKKINWMLSSDEHLVMYPALPMQMNQMLYLSKLCSPLKLNS